MKLFVMDAFTDVRFGGNPAGVVLLDKAFPPEAEMRAVAAELRYSETAFLLPEKDGFRLRYFTPVEEVELCGHATVASFSALRMEGLKPGRYRAFTKAGDLNIDVEKELVWMDMAPPVSMGALSESAEREVYASFGLTEADRFGSLRAEIVSTGLADILLPVSSDALDRLQPDFAAISRYSKDMQVTGVHVFSPGQPIRCRNFAPLYGIDEEAATGTSNGALTYYLFLKGLIRPEETNRFLQGEAMGRPSVICSRLYQKDGAVTVRVGGGAVRVVKGELE